MSQAPQNLQSFVTLLKNQGELQIIDAPTDPYLEIPEIHRRVIAANGPALLFTNVKNKNFPVVTNLFGTKKRVGLAFGDNAYKFISTLAKAPEEMMPPKISKLWQKREFLKSAAKVGFKKITKRSSPVLAQEIPHADMSKLPALTSWIEDGGPFLTLPLVHTKIPKELDLHAHAKENLGMYRIQIFSPNQTGLHFQIGKGGGFHLSACEQKNIPLPVNIYLGGPPALILSAIAPLPENVPELLLTSLLTGKKLSRAHSSEFAIDPVAEAEFLIVGESPPHVRKLEGPFGDHYGYYSLAHDFPVLNVKKIYHRKNAIFPATIVGKPRQEDFYLGDYLQELLSPMIKLVMPTVDDLWSYGETGYHCLSSCVIKKERYGREVLTTCFRILGEGQLSLTKFLLVLDKDIDLRDFRKVLTYVLERFDAKKDLNIFCETAYDTLDYTSQKLNFGSKGVLIGIGDPIRKLPESFSKEISSTLISKAKVFSPGCLVVQGKNYSEDKNLAKTLSEQKTLQDWPMIILVDDVEKTCRTVTSFLWTAFTRFEPARDIYANYQTHHHKNQYELPIVIDARMKPWFPKELFCDEDTKKLVDRRWQEYFPNNKIAMGSSDEGHLYL